MTRLFSLLGTLFVAAGLTLATAEASARMQAQVHDHDQHGAAAPDNPDTLAEGGVQKVDKDTGKLTIKHGPLNDLGMPAMTMAFKVRDPAMLDQVKAGEQVRFRVERANGSLVITRLEVSK